MKKGEIQLGEEIDCCVPTGNFGNILAALYAKKVGVPFGRYNCLNDKNS